MRSFGQIVADCQSISGDSGSAQKTLFQTWINQTDKLVQGLRPFYWLNDYADITTTDDGSAYELDRDCGKIQVVRLTDNNYPPLTKIETMVEWENLQSYNTSACDVPQFWMRRGNVLHVWPAIDTASQTLRVTFIKRRKDMSADDYTTGTIVSIANGATTVTGSDTTFTAKMVGRYIKFEGTTGDNNWYEIDSYTSATVIDLVKDYEGTSVAAASDTYRIGEMSLIPEEFQDILLWRPLAIFFSMHEKTSIANQYWRLYDGGHEAGLVDPSRPLGGILGRLLADGSSDDDSPYIHPHRLRREVDVNDPPTNLTGFT